MSSTPDPRKDAPESPAPARGAGAPAGPQAEPAGSGLAEQIAERRSKREALATGGLDPYPARYERTATAIALRERFGGLGGDARSGEVARVAGRLTSIRGHGRLVFATLRDVSGSLQLLLEPERLPAASASVLERCDVGDWVGAEGEVVTSRRGELSVDVVDLAMLAKALRPLPDKWRGLADPETRYRQREVDLLANASSRRVFEIRVATVASLRQTLVGEGFLEVDTPVLQPQAGGALARPFTTTSHALGIDLTLRIAPELYLKRLVVGGYERVFEIARSFRNEGIDTRHSPEFTVLEAYQAFGDYRDGMNLTERLIVNAARASAGRLTFNVFDKELDLSPPWPRRRLLDLLEEVTGTRLHPDMPVVDLRGVCDSRGVAYDPGWPAGKLIFELYENLVQPATTGPVLITGFPVAVSPLARHTRDDPSMADRFELVVCGRELANGYSELNDPDEQRERFEAEERTAASGDLESHPGDAWFVRALEYGLPPTSGIGIGLDRLVMLFAEVRAIRDVILFPLLRPEARTQDPGG